MSQIVLSPVLESAPKTEALDPMESDPPEQSIKGADIPLSASSSCKKVQVEDSDVSSIDDQDELLPRPVRKKRPNRRYTEWSSDDEYCLRALKRSFPKYKEADSSSESESDFTRPARDTTMKPTGLPIGVVRGCPKCSDCQAVLARWRPEEGCKPLVDAAPVFYPTEEEFKDTLKYIAKIRSAAEPFGICRVVPPPGWQPPCPLREDTAKLHVMKFPTRVQEIHKLQVRQPVKKCSQARQRLGGRRGRGGFRGRMGRPCRRTPNLSTTKSVQPDESFGFEPGSYFSLSKFEKYAQQFKEQYFFRADAADEVQGSPETGSDSVSRMNPPVDAIEAEYWRIVERPTEQIEVLYGADVETGSFGSGFPKAKAGDNITGPNSYEKSGWNLNNIARLPGSMLAFEEGDISGVLVPWLYVGMCFSSFCWHVEDHHFYSLNYLHWGAPKVWYGVSGHAAHDMEAVMKKHLPELFDEQPDLLHKLVTQLSPSVLRREGVPVYRLVQQAGEFVITFPRAYHSGFNCGFNCAEAVNLAPVDWLPHGQGAVELYREQRRKTSVSHDKLLLAAAREAAKVLVHSRNQQCMQNPPLQGVKQEYVEVEKNRASGGDTEILYAWQTFCGQGGVLVSALKARVELESSRQASLTGEVLMKKMDHCFDATDERECAECHYDLHLSAVGCECCPDKYVCLAHAPVLCVCHWGRKFVLYRYSLAELELLVAALEEQPGAISTWLEQQQHCSSSSILPHSASPHEDSGLAHTFGPCEFNSTQFPFCKNVFKAQDLESRVESQTKYMTSRPSVPGISDNLLSHQGSRGINTQVTASSSKVFANSIAQVLPESYSVASGLDERKINASGVQTRGQLAMYSERKRMQTSSAKIAKQVGETSVVKSRQEVIVLSDDEEGNLKKANAVVSSITKSHEGNSAGLHSLTSKAAFLDSARSSWKQSMCATDADCALSGTCLERQLVVPDGATLASVVPQLKLNLPRSKSAQLPDTILAPMARAQVQHHAVATEETPVSSPPYVLRGRSIGNLKQQARATSTQHLGSCLKVYTRADHAQRLQIGQEASAAEICGHLPVPDTQPTFMPSGNGVQSRTPVRLDRPVGPRVAKVVRKKVCCEVELLKTGYLVLREGWHDKHSIFPAGFKSRTSFCDVRNISQTCFYVSEIGESGSCGPQFKVSVEGNSTVLFVDTSIDMCWRAVQEKINGEIIRRRGSGETNLPPLQPPQSLHGLDMFGLFSPTIVQHITQALNKFENNHAFAYITYLINIRGSGKITKAIEALDPQHLCHEYWTAKVTNAGHCPPGHASEHCPSTPEENHMIRPKVSGVNLEVCSRPTTPTMGNLIADATPVVHSSKGNAELYSVLKGFFKKGNQDELWALHRLFSCEVQGEEWREGFQALTDVLDTPNP